MRTLCITSMFMCCFRKLICTGYIFCLLGSYGFVCLSLIALLFSIKKSCFLYIFYHVVMQIVQWKLSGSIIVIFFIYGLGLANSFYGAVHICWINRAMVQFFFLSYFCFLLFMVLILHFCSLYILSVLYFYDHVGFYFCSTVMKVEFYVIAREGVLTFENYRTAEGRFSSCLCGRIFFLG